MKQVTCSTKSFILLCVFVPIILFTLLFPSPARAQTNIQWIHQFGTSSADSASGISVDAYGMYVTGNTSGTLPGQTNAGGNDAFVRKYDVDSNEIWTRQFGTSSGDSTSGISVDASGVYVTGSTSGTLPSQTSTGEQDAFVRKYDADGNEVWTHQFGTSSGDSASGISVDATGVYVSGSTSGTLPSQTSTGEQDAFIRKYDVDGNEVWTHQFGTSSSDSASGISVDASGVYVSGHTSGTLPAQTNTGKQDAFVRKYDVDGNEVWTRQFGSADSDTATGISVDASGVYVSGYTSGTLPGQTSAGEGDAFVRKYDVDGNEVWTRQFGTTAWDWAMGISVDSTGVYAAGKTAGTLPGQANEGRRDIFVRKYDTDGNEAWTRQFGAPSIWDWASGISVHTTGVYAAGFTGGTLPGQTNAGFLDAFVVKLQTDQDEDGISDHVDGKFQGQSYVDQSTTFSDDFTDEHLSGTSFGSISDRSDLTITIQKAVNPDGLRIEASDGAGTATVRACQKNLQFTDGDVSMVTCSSLIVQVLVGPIEILLSEDTFASVPSETTATVIELDEGQLKIENSPESTGTIVIETQGKITEVAPGESSLSITIDVKPTGSGNGHNVIELEVDDDDDDECEDDSRLKVGILTTADFDALTVDPQTVALGDPTLEGTVEPIRQEKTKTKDLDHDGDEDLLLSFSICNMVDNEALDTNTTNLVLTGETSDHTAITGSDSVIVKQDDD